MSEVEKKKKQTRFSFIRLDKIILPDPDQDADWNNVFAIAETIPIVGMVTPIIVRRVTERQGSAKHKKIVLVAGRDRFEAAALARLERVPCFFIKGDETHIRLAAVTENIWRKRLTPLQRAELLAEYYRLALVPANISGHDVQKIKPGRPRGGLAEAARKIPSLGGSLEARRKVISRSEKIASLPAEVKKAAVEARLDKSSKAAARNRKRRRHKEAIKKISELRASRPSPEDEPAAEDGNPGARKESRRAQSNTSRAEENSKQVTLADLNKAWEKKCRRLWAHTRHVDRQAFVDKIMRANCKARADVHDLLQRAIRGRKRIEKRVLFAYAKSQGISEKAVRRATKELGFTRGRSGQAAHTTWYFNNPARHPEDQLLLVYEKDLEAAKEQALKRKERIVHRWEKEERGIEVKEQDEQEHYLKL